MTTREKILIIIGIRLAIWLLFALGDMAHLYRFGYEGSVSRFELALNAYITYCVLALIAIVIAWFSSSFRGKNETSALAMHDIAWDIAVLLLMTVGLRINELYLPSVKDPISILANIVMVIVAVGIGFAWRRLAGPPKRRLGLVLVLIFITNPALILLSADLLNRSKSNLDRSEHDLTNIVLITLDTVRADHLGSYGYVRDTSPNFDSFASENHLFTNCRTPMPLTSPAHASLFSGEMPHLHGVFTNISHYPDDPEPATLAERISRQRMHASIGFPAAVHMGTQFNFDRGFDTYNQSTVLNGPDWLQSMYQLAPYAILSRLGIIRETYLVRDSRQVNRAFFHWLDHNQQPFFAWLHYFDAHSPYQPPEESWRRYDPDYEGPITGSQDELERINEQMEETGFGETLPDGFSRDDIDSLIARYDGEIRFQDESLGELFEELKRKDLWDDTAIIIVSDHGEGMYDDGYFGHNFTLSEYEIRLACAIKGPDIEFDEDTPLSLTDLTGYILDIVDIDHSDNSRLAGEDTADEANDDPYTSMVFLRSHCWIDPPYKLVRTWSTEGGGVTYSLYNFVDDPSEAIDIFDPLDERSIEMKSALQSWLDENDADFPALVGREGSLEGIDQATLEMLRSLGYIY